MKAPERSCTCFSINAQSAAKAALNLGRKALAGSLTYLMVPLGMGDLYAQSAPPPPPDQGQYSDQGGPPPGNYTPMAPDQINQLVAPIALYPDSLVAQILAASTYPDQVADADHFLQQNQGAPQGQLAQMIDGMNWDPSVKALVAFPSVLANLDKNMDWTSQLGNVYYNQPQDVMDAVQVMRQRAYEAGNLKTDQQMVVQYQPSNIVIAPANPTVVYVPYYNPWVVYGAPIVAYPAYYPPPQPAGYFAAGLVIGFGVGIAVASWNRYGWGWNRWGMGWSSHTVVYNRNVYVSRSITVVNRGYYGHYDRNVAARDYNRKVATTYNNNYNKNNSTYNKTTNTYNKTNNNYNKNGNTYNKPANTQPNNNVRPAYTNNTYKPPSNQPNNNTRPATGDTYKPPSNQPNNNTRPATGNTYKPPSNQPNNNTRPATGNTYRPPSNQPNNNTRPPANANSNYNKQANTQQRQPAPKPSGNNSRPPSDKNKNDGGR